ncbi:ATP-binding cassette domain-containing protein [Marinilongibacter aquaticus]|uniref:cell division ATP-binding protein FtsE n=1 Tax=Marinilongibacter aquaticus TaxID=2975157 RepID=UPI0021BDDEEC|nr:ATP-binding cassette domain-containing protein [Marinilongibacter aquaticus]UBM59329.1 ATP-binding cassette domain-containing protein [Marinilongibacter aquaticus]
MLISVQNADIYQKEQLILRDVSFSIEKGEFVYLIGKTGSGKSSLLKTLYADLWLERGKATVASHNLHEIRKSEIPTLRRKIGIVFQDFQLLTDRDIQKNMDFFLRAMGWEDASARDQRLIEVLSAVGLPDVLKKMPHQLSGGEQQRIAIARALLNKPEIIIADEPTGNLDPEKSIEILQLFMKINQESGTAVLMATHDLELIERFPKRTIFCNDKQVKDLTDNL